MRTERGRCCCRVCVCVCVCVRAHAPPLAARTQIAVIDSSPVEVIAKEILWTLGNTSASPEPKDARAFLEGLYGDVEVWMRLLSCRLHARAPCTHAPTADGGHAHSDRTHYRRESAVPRGRVARGLQGWLALRQVLAGSGCPLGAVAAKLGLVSMLVPSLWTLLHSFLCVPA